MGNAEVLIEGGRLFEGKLEAPVNQYNFCKDVAVLAFPVNEETSTSRTEKIKISSNLTGIDLDNIFATQPKSITQIPATKDGNVYINMKFPDDFTARSISYEVRPQGKATTSATNIPGLPAETFVGTGYRILLDLGQLEVSEDGINYKTVCNLKENAFLFQFYRQVTRLLLLNSIYIPVNPILSYSLIEKSNYLLYHGLARKMKFKLLKEIGRYALTRNWVDQGILHLKHWKTGLPMPTHVSNITQVPLCTEKRQLSTLLMTEFTYRSVIRVL